jgi:predicted small lipoprotein YifL
MKAKLLLAACTAFLGACGQTGDLYLPESRQGEVITRPAAPRTESPPSDATPGGSPGTVDSPSQPTPPAPEVTPPGAAGSPDAAKKKDGTAPPKP